jgi:hypothetical protein
MSTILKTLKKLEEEKNILRHKGDLKEMVLQEDEGNASHVSSVGQENWIWIGGGVLLGVLVTAGLFYFSQPETPTLALPKITNGETTKRSLAVSRPLDKIPASFSGIPLESIPEREIVFESASEPIHIEEPLAPVEQIEEFPEAVAIESPEPKNFAEEPMQEIGELIQSAILTESEEAKSPRHVLSRSAVYFPEIRVKGIIFFEDGSASNHIFVSTPTTTNQKLKIGNEVEEALLESITAQAAIFKYQGHLVELPIGD